MSKVFYTTGWADHFALGVSRLVWPMLACELDSMIGRKSFTLIELLVVIAIIAMLVALLFPVLRTAKDSANGVACMSNLKQLGLAFALYGEDKGRYPFSGTTIAGVNTEWPTFLNPYVGKTNNIDAGDVEAFNVFMCPGRYIRTEPDGTYVVRETFEPNLQILGSGDWSPVPSQYPRVYPFTERPAEVMLLADTTQRIWIDSGSSVWNYGAEFTTAYSSATANTVIPYDPALDVDGYVAWNEPPGGRIRWRHGGNSSANFLFFDGHVASVKKDQFYRRYVRINPPIHTAPWP
jgi:prepilin-type processing-associated H-X9-DG protein/prepilin-type N-terminal cleavage/methylation domain-containing protein